MPTITTDCTIDDSEFGFETSRSGGPGGQNVNKVESKVTLVFDLGTSRSLTDRQRAILVERLANRLVDGATLRLSCQETRSQAMNRELVVARFVALLKDALRPRRIRKPTRPTAGSKRRRLADKKRRSGAKQDRRTKGHDE